MDVTTKKINTMILHIDNGGEYVNRDVQHLYSEVGIKLQHIVPPTPQQNNIAKQKNRSIQIEYGT
jgi:transposase InsO family protein